MCRRQRWRKCSGRKAQHSNSLAVKLSFFCWDSWFLSLIPNLSNADAVGWRPTWPTITPVKHFVVMSKLSLRNALQRYSIYTSEYCVVKVEILNLGTSTSTLYLCAVLERTPSWSHIINMRLQSWKHHLCPVLITARSLKKRLLTVFPDKPPSCPNPPISTSSELLPPLSSVLWLYSHCGSAAFRCRLAYLVQDADRQANSPELDGCSFPSRAEATLIVAFRSRLCPLSSVTHTHTETKNKKNVQPLVFKLSLPVFFTLFSYPALHLLLFSPPPTLSHSQ